MNATKPKIVIVAHDVGGQGGMEKHLEEVLTRTKQDYDVTVVAASMKLSEPGGIRFIRIPVIARPVPLKMVMFAVLASLRLLTIKRDLLHTTGAIVFNRADVSTVHFCHAGYKREGGSRIREARSVMFKLNRWLASAISLRMEKRQYRLRRTKALIAVSNRVKREIAENLAYASDPITVIPNGVDHRTFKPSSPQEKVALREKHGLPPKGTFLLFMGGDWTHKGLRYVLEAFNRLGAEFHDLHLLVVGRGDQAAFEKDITAECRSRVIFAGVQKKPEEWFGMSDMFLFPSCYETFSLVTHEAAAAGLTIFSTRVGGVEDLLEEPGAGFFIDRNAESIIDQVRTVLAHPDRDRYGEAARQRVLPLTWDHTYERMDGLYKEILNGTINRSYRSLKRPAVKNT